MQAKVIESVVLKNKALCLNTHNPKEYSVYKISIKGSLWIGTYEGKKYKGTRVQTTGEVAFILNNHIEHLKTSRYVGEHHGYKYWFVEDSREVEKIIDIFGQN